MYHDPFSTTQPLKRVSSPVLLAVNKFLNQFLKKECLPFTIPSFPSCLLFPHMSMKRLLQFFSSHSHVPGKAMNDHENNNIENLPLEVKLLISGMNILCSFIRITKLCPSKTKERFFENENLETEMSFIKNSLAQLNCSLDECSSVLSQKCTYLNHMTNSVCMHENSNKFQTGLTEVSAIMWDMLSKITSPVKVYTHHEALLWWCFRNPQFNSYGSFVLQTWMKFCLSYDDDLELHSTFKLLLKLLTTIDVAQETFIRQFESNSEISFYFLKSICDSEVKVNLYLSHYMFKNENSNVKENEKFDTCSCPIYKNYLVRILAVKNHIDEKSEDNFLSIGLECILWCYGQIHVNPQIDMKFIFHDFENEIIPIHCLKFLHFTITKDERDSQAWFIITGNTRFISFLQNCLAMHQQFVNEVLILLVAIVRHQTVGRLKSSSYVTVSLKQFCKWLNNSRTKFMSFDLLNCLLDVEFDGTFLRINSIEHEQNISLLTRNDLRILVFYVQNAMILGDPALEKIISMTFRKLLYYISKTDSSLENHIMLQPWVKLVLESRLEDIYASWDLFEKWFTYKTENITLDEIMQRFADEILTKPQEPIKSKHSVIKLYSSVYKKCLSKETKVALKEIMDAQSKSNIEEKEENNLVCEVENLVTSYISHNSVVINS
ncbi:meiosis inhibitor protein 1 [Caerostris extrusa]|uniref:Meiosis inhibitor protein 1 n=1 Tax=Caerostris extrusa TaxID=172846 RepID=A0AAV4XPJ0_CAEEX|nr:meiosis inhibitor protein 1 [Caerostris extrusa]